MHTHHTYCDFFDGMGNQHGFSPFDGWYGWLTFHGLWYKRVDAQMNNVTRDLHIFLFFLCLVDGWLMFDGLRYICFFDVTSNARKLL